MPGAVGRQRMRSKPPRKPPTRRGEHGPERNSRWNNSYGEKGGREPKTRQWINMHLKCESKSRCGTTLKAPKMEKIKHFRYTPSRRAMCLGEASHFFAFFRRSRGGGKNVCKNHIICCAEDDEWAKPRQKGEIKLERNGAKLILLFCDFSVLYRRFVGNVFSFSEFLWRGRPRNRSQRIRQVHCCGAHSWLISIQF